MKKEFVLISYRKGHIFYDRHDNFLDSVEEHFEILGSLTRDELIKKWSEYLVINESVDDHNKEDDDYLIKIVIFYNAEKIHDEIDNDCRIEWSHDRLDEEYFKEREQEILYYFEIMKAAEAMEVDTIKENKRLAKIEKEKQKEAKRIANAKLKRDQEKKAKEDRRLQYEKLKKELE